MKLKPNIEKKIDRKKLGKRSRNKGSSFERTIAKRFEEVLGVDFVRTPQSGGFAKNLDKTEGFRGDIVPASKDVNFKLHIECKNTKTWSLPAWLKQAQGDCPKDKIPVVIFHQHGTSNNYITLNLEDFFSIIDDERIILEGE